MILRLIWFATCILPPLLVISVPMIWTLYASLCSLFSAAQGAWIKGLLKRIDSYIITWAAFAFAFPFLLGLLPWAGFPHIEPPFWPALFAGLVLNLLALTLYVRAIGLSPLSLTFPFLSFTPLFLILTSWLILGELPRPLGIVGILLIVAGAYAINLEKLAEGPLSPFRSIYREKGSLLMLIVALIWSVTSNIDKVCVLKSSPLFYLTLFYLIFPILYLPVVLIRSRGKFVQIGRNLPSLLILGVFGALFIFFQMLAIRVALVTYVIGMKRARMVFSILFGFLFFGERYLKYRLLGAAFMIGGVACIVLS